MGDLAIIIASLRRTINHHDSRIYRLPPEILATVASHLEDDESLVTATRVCHLWRTTLLSSPRIWSHLDFENEQRALVFLERSKSTPLVVDLVDTDDPSEVARKSMNEIATRTIALRADHGLFLDELLARPMPLLEVMEVTESEEPPPKKPAHLPSLTSLIISSFGPLLFHAPLLTSFHLAYDPIDPSEEWKAGILLDFLQSCPLLEAIFLRCEVHPDSDKVVSLPFLRSFTHESPCAQYQLYLFDRLFLPSTCRVVLANDVTGYLSDPWTLGIPALRDSSYLSDIKTIKISARSRDPGESHVTFRTEFVNSTHKTLSFNRISCYSNNLSDYSHRGFWGFLGGVRIGSVETLCFDHYQVHTHFTLAEELRKFRNLKTLVLAECNVILSLNRASSFPTDTLVVYSRHGARRVHTNPPRVQEFAASRKKAGYPLKAVTLVYPFAKLPPSELEELKSCVGSVKAVSGDDALGWDMDEYLLGMATHGDNSNRS